MKLNELRDTSYEIAKSKGWHDSDAPRASLADRCALIISELSEALEEYRAGHAPHQVYFGASVSELVMASSSKEAQIWAAEGKKPEGVPIEMADVCIRIGDLAGRYELDLNRVQDSRIVVIDWSEPEEDLGLGCEFDQKSFSDWLMVGTHLAVSAWMERTSDDRPSDETTRNLILLTFTMFKMAEVFDIDLAAAIQIKHAFNRTRPYRHGGKKI